MASSPTAGSLFTGAGGLDLGLHAAGYTTAWACENDPHCRRVLEHRFPGLLVVPDVRDVDESLPRVDVLAGGFPCQDLSYAGKGAGLDGARSGLWFEFARAVCVLRPRHVIVENVGALANRGLGRVLADLAEAGYVGSWLCVRASDVGAPHRRERLFILASLADAERGAERRARPGGVPSAAGAGACEASERQRVRADAGHDGGALADADELDLRAGRGRRRTTSRPPARADQATAADADAAGLQGRERPELPPRGRRQPPECAETATDAAGCGLARRQDREKRGRERVEASERQEGDEAASDGHRAHVDWGVYEPAIRRWEQLTRPAPAPTDDRRRLNPRFVEWMLGYPQGWVDVPGVSRTAQLRMLGNAVQCQVGTVVGELLARSASARTAAA